MRTGLTHSAITLLLGALVTCGPSAPPPAAPAGSVGTASSSAPAANGSATAVAQPAEHVRMSFAGQAAHFAPVWVAKDGGLFEKYGIDAEVSFLPSRQASAALVAND